MCAAIRGELRQSMIASASPTTMSVATIVGKRAKVSCRELLPPVRACPPGCGIPAQSCRPSSSRSHVRTRWCLRRAVRPHRSAIAPSCSRLRAATNGPSRLRYFMSGVPENSFHPRLNECLRHASSAARSLMFRKREHADPGVIGKNEVAATRVMMVVSGERLQKRHNFTRRAHSSPVQVSSCVPCAG